MSDEDDAKRMTQADTLYSEASIAVQDGYLDVLDEASILMAALGDMTAAYHHERKHEGHWSRCQRPRCQNARLATEGRGPFAALSSPETTPAGVLPDELRHAIEALPKQQAVVNMDDPREWWIDVVSRAAVLEIVDRRTPAGVLDEAWAAAEKALPEGWTFWGVQRLAGRWYASAIAGVEPDVTCDQGQVHRAKRGHESAFGDTPVEAAVALAAALGRSGSGGGRG